MNVHDRRLADRRGNAILIVSGARSRRVARAMLAACAMVLALATGSALHAEPVSVQGTKVSMDPPAGFAPAKRFPGFQSEEYRSAIMVSEIPGPIADVRAGMTRRGLATRGMVLLNSETKTIAGREALVLSVSQKAHGQVFRKRMVVFGDGKNSVVIVATFPEAFAGTAGPAIEQSLLSARWNPNKVLDPLEGLPFRITESGSLKIANRMSSALLLTEGGAKGAVAPAEPFLVITSSVDDRRIADLKSFAQNRMARIRQVKDLDSIVGRALTVDGVPAFELLATAADRRTGTPLRIYQLMISDGKGYFLAQGMVGVAKGDTYIAQFREISESLRNTP